MVQVQESAQVIAVNWTAVGVVSGGFVALIVAWVDLRITRAVNAEHKTSGHRMSRIEQHLVKVEVRLDMDGRGQQSPGLPPLGPLG